MCPFSPNASLDFPAVRHQARELADPAGSHLAWLTRARRHQCAGWWAPISVVTRTRLGRCRDRVAPRNGWDGGLFSWRVISTILRGGVLNRMQAPLLQLVEQMTSIVAETIDPRKRRNFPVDSRV